jgi:hypothetical protein
MLVLRLQTITSSTKKIKAIWHVAGLKPPMETVARNCQFDYVSDAFRHAGRINEKIKTNRRRQSYGNKPLTDKAVLLKGFQIIDKIR